MAKKTPVAPAAPETIQPLLDIPQIVINEATLTVVGISPLIVHRWGTKARMMMRTKQIEGISPKKERKVPERECEDAKYKEPGTGKEGISALTFKSAAVESARFIEGVKMTYLKGVFFIMPDFYDEDGIPCLYINGKSQMREDMVRVGMGTADIRYRPVYPEWSVTMRVRYDPRLLPLDNLVTLFNRAGFSGGVGDWRPSSPKGTSGEFGRFEVKLDG